MFRDLTIIAVIFALGVASGYSLLEPKVVTKVVTETVTEIVNAPPVIKQADTELLGEHEGTKFYAVTNKVDTFKALVDQVCQQRGEDEKILLLDLHLNWYHSNHDPSASNDCYGPVTLANSGGLKFGDQLLSNYHSVYEASGLKSNRNPSTSTARQFSLRLLSEGIACDLDVVISEFAFMDDCKNANIIKFLRSNTGSIKVAEAIRDAGAGKYDKIILTAGHHRNEGSDPVVKDGFSEIDHSFLVMNAMSNLLNGANVAQVTRYGYTGDKYSSANDRRWIGNRGNTLEPGLSVSLSPELAAAIDVNLKRGDFVKVFLPLGPRVFRVDDTTRRGLKNFRVDFFDPYGDFKEYDGSKVVITRYQTDSEEVNVKNSYSLTASF